MMLHLPTFKNKHKSTCAEEMLPKKYYSKFFVELERGLEHSSDTIWV